MTEFSPRRLFDTLVVPTDYRFADPWRMYQDVELLGSICAEASARLSESSVDIIAGVSDLGFPLAIALAAHLYDEDRGTPAPILFTTDSTSVEGDWMHPQYELHGRRVLLCDDLLAGGGHMLECLRRLERVGAECVAALVILDNRLVRLRTAVDEIRNQLGDRLIALVSVGPSIRS